MILGHKFGPSTGLDFLVYEFMYSLSSNMVYLILS